LSHYHFKKGDFVSHNDYGTGIVIKIRDHQTYPLVVKVDSDESLLYFTLDGRDIVDGEIELRLI